VRRLIRDVRLLESAGGSNGSGCKFDYRLEFGTYKDYYTGRELFESTFYSAAVNLLSFTRQFVRRSEPSDQALRHIWINEGTGKCLDREAGPASGIRLIHPIGEFNPYAWSHELGSPG